MIKITDNKLQLGFKCKISYYKSRSLLITAFAITHSYQLSSTSQPFYTFISGILSNSCYAVHFCANNGIGYLCTHVIFGKWADLLWSQCFDNQPSIQLLSSHHHRCSKSVRAVLNIYLKDLQTEKGQNLSLTHFEGCTFTNQDKSPLNQ